MTLSALFLRDSGVYTLWGPSSRIRSRYSESLNCFLRNSPRSTRTTGSLDRAVTVSSVFWAIASVSILAMPVPFPKIELLASIIRISVLREAIPHRCWRDRSLLLRGAFCDWCVLGIISFMIDERSQGGEKEYRCGPTAIKCMTSPITLIVPTALAAMTEKRLKRNQERRVSTVAGRAPFLWRSHRFVASHAKHHCAFSVGGWFMFSSIL